MINEYKDLKNKVVLITGTSGVIGKSLVQGFDQNNCKVIGLDLRRSTSTENSAFESIEIDVSNQNDIKKCVNYIVKKYGSIDVLINNHQFKPKGFLDSSPENIKLKLWKDIIDINLTGTFIMCQEVGKIMLKKKTGSIINFASTYGVVSSNPSLYSDNSMGNPIAYSASKGGVIMLSKYLGCYWAKEGLRVNCITPHGVENEHEETFINQFNMMSPSNRMMKVHEVTNPVLFLSSNASSYINASNLIADGGWTSW